MVEGRTLAGRYQILDKLGTGGMAEVYRATDTVLGRTVAIKIMLPQYASDQTFAARFRQEAQAAASLNSPYIVSIYDWGMDGDTYYIVMEYIKGTDLKSGIRRNGPIAMRKAAQIGAQVCAGLEAAHKQGIIHRDIKPQNIMIQPDGTAKVMDFGIARAQNSNLTQPNSVLGTAHYVSPEQTQGKDLGPESDIYSLGVVLYECVTGRVPFEGDSAVSVALKQVNDTPILPSDINPQVDEEFESIILKAMQKDPHDRFSSAKEFRHTLNNYISGVSTGLTKTNVLPGAMPPQATDQTKTTVLPAAKGSAQPRNNPYMYEDFEEEEKSDKKKKVRIGIAIVIALLLGLGIIFALVQCNKTADVAVPNLVGLTREQAIEEIEENGFVLGKIDSEYSDEAPEGTVIDQDPDAETMAPEESQINLVISNGKEPPKEVAVPDLSNLTASQAESALKDVGLTPQAGDAVYDDNVEAGLVVSQDPSPGATAHEGDVVTYITSLGAESIEIPDVVGQSQSNATSRLKNTGFSVSVSEQENEASAGTVISMNPSAGTKIEAGSTVTIVVSVGIPKVSVPNVVDLDKDTAIKKIEDAGLRYDLQTKAVNDTQVIIEQNISPGTEVEPGTTVQIVLDEGRPSPLENLPFSGDSNTEENDE